MATTDHPTYAHAPGDPLTSDSPDRVPMDDLEARALAEDRQAFVTQARTIDWSQQHPDQLARAIDLALSLELAALAIDLAQHGGRLFPDHGRLQQAARVLAPPIVRSTRAAAPDGLRASRIWLRTHAHAYRGQWVAVQDGQILGAAESLHDLQTQIGSHIDPRNTIVTRVL